MFSKRFYHILRVILRISKLFNVSPLCYQPRTMLLYCDNSKRFRLKMQRNFVIVQLWLIGSLIQVYCYYKREDLDRINLSLAFIVGAVILSIINTIAHFYSNDLCQVINGLLTLFRFLHRVYMPDFRANTSNINKLHDMILYILAVGMFLFNLALNLYLLWDPTGTIFVGSEIPKKYLPFTVKVVLLFIHAYTITYLNISACISGGFVVVYSFYVTMFYTSELRIGQRPIKYKSINKLRETSSIIRVIYRAFQVLQKYNERLFGPYILILDGAFMFTAIYLNFVIIRYWSSLHMFAKAPLIGGDLSVMIAWTVVMEFGRVLFSRGNKMLNSWKGDKWGSREENKLMSRFQLSCTPILFSYGSLFVMRKGSLFSFYKGVVKGTMRSILTTNK